MKLPTRILITAGFVCHLLLAPPLVTSQLRASSRAHTHTPSDTKKSSVPSACPLQKDQNGVCALEQEKDGPVFKLRGQVELHYLNFILRADEAQYNSDTGAAEASGHVTLDGGPNDEHIQASRGSYNLQTETGKFEDVYGTIGLRMRASRLVLTSPDPFSFRGKLVEKTAPDHYIVHDGSITTCEVSHPRWQFFARKVEVDAASDAKVYHSTFRIEGVPLLFLPYVSYPIERQRQSGFLIPNLGNSSIKGVIVGESVYWAINRAMDVNLGAEYFSLRGWAPQGEFRARPSETSFVDLRFTSVLDRGYGPTHIDQGGADVRLNAQGTFPFGFRGVADIDYLTSFVYRLAFNEIFTQAVYSEVKSHAFVSKATNGFSYNVATERYQDFESTDHGDVITILHAPSVEVGTVDRQFGGSPFYWSFDASAGGLSRSEPLVPGATGAFRTADLVGRFDLSPTLSLPLQYRGWAVRPELTLRNTFYTQEISLIGGTRTAVSDPINRKALEGSVEIRPPVLERVFDREFIGRKWKHVVEPSVAYRYVTGVNNFEHLLRFDARDILSDTNEVEYGVVNRLFAKWVTPPRTDCDPQGMPSSLLVGTAPPPQGNVPWGREQADESPCVPEPEVREVVTWELAQKYFLDPTFGGALIPGQRNVFTTTAELTGDAFLTEERHLSPLISRLRVQTTQRTNAEWDLDYDFKAGGINASTALINYEFGSFIVGGGDAFLRIRGVPSAGISATPPVFNQFRAQFGYGRPSKRGFSGATSVGFDANVNFLQYAALQTTYNWGCCGFTAEYRRFALGSVRNENQFRFSLALANLGSIGNLTRRDRLF